jgi:hypothetical protein
MQGDLQIGLPAFFFNDNRSTDAILCLAYIAFIISGRNHLQSVKSQEAQNIS